MVAVQGVWQEGETRKLGSAVLENCIPSISRRGNAVLFFLPGGHDSAAVGSLLRARLARAPRARDRGKNKQTTEVHEPRQGGLVYFGCLFVFSSAGT